MSIAKTLSHLAAIPFLSGRNPERDSLMRNFLRLTSREQQAVAASNCCYSWAAGNEATVYETDSKLRREGGWPQPGDSTQVPYGILGLQDDGYGLRTTARLAMLDGAQWLPTKASLNLPAVPAHHRRIALTLYQLGKSRDFHFWAEGESGYWSCMPSGGSPPTCFDEDKQVIADPRRAVLSGERLGPTLFFAIPKEGLELRLTPKVRADVIAMRKIVNLHERELLTRENAGQQLENLAAPYLAKAAALTPQYAARLRRNLLAQFEAS